MASANTDYDNLGLIPVDLNLNGRSFVLDQSRGVFVAGTSSPTAATNQPPQCFRPLTLPLCLCFVDKGSDDAISADARARMQEMQNEMKQMKVAQRDLASKMKELEVTNRSLEFKNQVLLELVR